MLHEKVGRSVEKGRLSSSEHDDAFARLTLTTDLAAAATQADLVIEAVVERLDVKRGLFADLGRLCPPATVLTSNSSGFVPSAMADASGRPERFCNMHFFNPALVMRCVEVVRGPQTSDATVETVVDVARRMGKDPVVLDKEIPGFVANRILNAVRDEAVELYESGVASLEAIDAVCRTALGHPLGPFELQDLTGLDVGYLYRQARYAETGDPRHLPSRSLAERVERGDLGRKTGRGWYSYDD
jgi:3-hydroxybutyryl-CoA dehydrogenase